ncbi:MAG TPA: amino acid ABC transporter permease [Microthrixaceae bacterium]|nr:amino acid ABC transporter permease [Microthrixaceae bacterium]
MTVALYDAPGPRARRRTLVGSLIGGAALLLLGALVIKRLSDTGQFRGEFWEPFGRAGVQRILLRGLVATLKAAGLALVLALVLGVVLAVGRLSSRRSVRIVSSTAVQGFRALPLVFLILFAFIALPELGIDTGPFSSVVIGLTLYNGAVLAEIFRAGILAVPRGQVEAAYSIGLRKGSVLRVVQLPQAVRIMLPALVSQLVVLVKDSALGFIVAYPELLRSGRRIYTNIGNVIPTAMVIAAIYITINLILSGVAAWIEARQRGGWRRRSGVPVEMSLGVPDAGVAT